MPTPYEIEWTNAARADVRRLDRPTALKIFEGILRFARGAGGSVLSLQGDLLGVLRLRIGDYRVLFTVETDRMQILGVRHRSDAYRQ